MQSVVYSKGNRRIFYKATNFSVGKAVTAYIWSPQLVKGSKQTLSELSDGLYYLDYTFNELGQYVALFYENDNPTTTRIFTVTERDSSDAKKTMQLLIALFK